MIHTISPKDLQLKLQSNACRVIDIREEYEFKICSFVETNIPMGQFTDQVSRFNKQEEIILICKTGKRAKALANLIECEHAFEKITILEGGIMAWIETIDSKLETY